MTSSIERLFRVSILMIVSFNVLLVFAATVMIERMGPQIDQVLAENVPFLQASESLLEILARRDFPMRPSTEDRFHQALKQVGKRIVYENQKNLIVRLNELAPQVGAGESRAIAEFVETLTRLGEIHRRIMRDVDRELSFERIAGAWAIVLMGVVSTLVSFMVLLRVERRVIRPVADMLKALTEWAKGNHLRRLKCSGEGSKEIRDAMQVVNDLMDSRS
jgi:hypothetical protein